LAPRLNTLHCHYVNLTGHPLKGPCQEKTPLHRKKVSFFYRDTTSVQPQLVKYPFLCALFFARWVRSVIDLHQAPIRIKAVIKKLSGLRSGEPPSSSERSNPSFFLPSPWSAERTPEKTSVLCHVQLIVNRTLGSLRPPRHGSWQRQVKKYTLVKL